MKPLLIPFLLLSLLFVSCGKGRTSSAEDPSIGGSATDVPVQYARGFTITKTPDYTELRILNPWADGKTLQRYILVDKNRETPANLPEGILIRTPLERIACFSSAQCGVLAELDAIHTVIGVCEPEYMKEFPSIQQGLAAGTVLNLGMAANPDVEKLMSIEPEAILASPLKESGYAHIEKIGLPLVECVDYMENTPLGRAEWIRFYALFFGREAFADSLFQTIAQTYTELKTLVSSVENRPTVLTETKYGAIWYLPGGKSYAAALLRDAGAAYYWENDDSTGSLSLSFESVLDRAEHADIWLIKCFREKDMTYKDLLSEDELYASFDAFKKKNIYVCNTSRVRYYEELPIHPEYVLKDLIRVFHPELLPEEAPRYYEKMETLTPKAKESSLK